MCIRFISKSLKKIKLNQDYTDNQNIKVYTSNLKLSLMLDIIVQMKHYYLLYL